LDNIAAERTTVANDPSTQRIEALLMGLLAYAHNEAARAGEDPEQSAKIYKILSRADIKGSEIAQVFGVSEATVSRRLNS
jgi:hypothetical protein